MTLGGAASEAVKGLSSQPLLLLIAVLNVAMLLIILYVGSSQREERADLTRYLVECHKS